MADGQLILIARALLAAGLGASLAAGRLRIPGLVVFLGLGMAVGSDGTGWLAFDDYGGRRMATAGPDEGAWLRMVIGAIAADRHR